MTRAGVAAIHGRNWQSCDMKWGIVFSSTGFPDAETAIDFAETAERAGFESLWAPEHIVVAVDGPTPYSGSLDGRMDRLFRRGGIPDPLIWFAYVAGRTSSIKFGTGVLILPEHNPVVLAKTAATLDHLSGGRLMLGIGVGELPEEYAGVGMEFTNRGKRMDESIHAMRALWRDDAATYEGRYVHFQSLACDPKPVHGAIPLHIGGISDAAIRRAATLGDGYFPFVPPDKDVREVLPVVLERVRSETRATGRDPDAMEFTAGGARTVEAAKWFADQGVHRLTIAVRAKTQADMHDELARFSDEVISATADL
jgi:probable F420-dependent oxidoreductase